MHAGDGEQVMAITRVDPAGRPVKQSYGAAPTGEASRGVASNARGSQEELRGYCTMSCAVNLNKEGVEIYICQSNGMESEYGGRQRLH